MAHDKVKETFAKIIQTALKSEFPDILNDKSAAEFLDFDFIYNLIEKPKDPKMGRFAIPVFRYSKLLKQAPPQIAAKLVESTSKNGNGLIELSASGGFINAKVDATSQAKEVLNQILTSSTSDTVGAGFDYGSSDYAKGKKILVEYSAPNIAKPFGIGHIRTTILGNSLRRIFKKLNGNVVGINYLGDWGTQFGKMLCAYKKWADDKIKGQEKVSDLLELYVRFHEEVENTPELDDEARLEFKKLEEGDPENTNLWKRFREVSLEEFNRIYDIMGIEFDWVTGEAFLEDKMEPAIEQLENCGLTSVSNDALIVDLKDDQLPPVLLRKADGATLYATRDIAGFLYRINKYDFDEMLYVVATNQAVHFQQVFKTIAMLEEAENIPEEKRYSNRAKHIEFGLIKFGDQMMSTRRGHIIYLEDVICKASDLAKEKIREKNPDLENIDEVARMIGLGAILFSQLSVRRQKEVNFNWDEVLSFEGETGPYLQYTHARLSSLLRNYEGDYSTKIDHKLLNREEEQRIIELLADFPEAVVDAGRNYEPNMISNYLLSLAASFNKFYQRKDENGRIDKIISDNADLTKARIALVRAVQEVIKEGLYLLGIEAPKAM